MYHRISFACPGCQSRLRASLNFGGRSCNCPRCGHEVVVPFRLMDEEMPALVMDDGHRRARRRDQLDVSADLASH